MPRTEHSLVRPLQNPFLGGVLLSVASQICYRKFQAGRGRLLVTESENIMPAEADKADPYALIYASVPLGNSASVTFYGYFLPPSPPPPPLILRPSRLLMISSTEVFSSPFITAA